MHRVSVKIMPHVQATANTVTVQCVAQMTVKTTTQSIPPVPRSYVTQGELWNSRIHQVLEIEAYRPTTTQCLCHHHTWLREGATSVQSLRLNIMCGRTCYSRQVTAYAANYWVAVCQNDEDGFLPGRPLRPYPPPIQNSDWKATWLRGVLENTPGYRQGLRRILRNGGSANKNDKELGFHH